MRTQNSEEYQPTSEVDFTFDLVSRLVTEKLADEHEELIIRSKSGEFFHDSDTRIEVADTLKLLISGAGLTETGFRTVITMSGTFTSINKESYTFSFYFIMKRTIPVIPRKELYSDNLTGRYLTLPILPSSERLYDALFSLKLESLTHGKNNHFGQGKGYLVFGRYL